VKHHLLEFVDRGVLGLTPLKTHVVICGFPRSGSTLLQLMAATCVAELRSFDREESGLVAARVFLRNHRYMLTKLPRDIYWIDEIREYYANRMANVRFIITLRDPRDLLTSKHKGRPDEYYVSCERWKTIYDHYRYVLHFDDVLVVRFEDLIDEVDRIEQQLTAFIGWEQVASFRSFYARDKGKFNTIALGDIRPLDRKGIGRWRKPEHRDRIKNILSEMPDLPKYLIELGYESDKSWIEAFEARTSSGEA